MFTTPYTPHTPHTPRRFKQRVSTLLPTPCRSWGPVSSPSLPDFPPYDRFG
ncbi:MULTISPECIES: hypothetical protein [Fischerella]|uniref:hypothetical protein n=1 Tax=Fischerella TaxID=1190 RepID=UPI0002EDDEB1|nr:MULTISPECIES: hypothetical protein [Fischerella]MBD2431865.1 hypothetical protein [Fischerella sp. FACHB-380]